MNLRRFTQPALGLALASLLGCNPTKDLAGAWFGTLDAGHVKSRLVLHLKRDGTAFKATIDLVDQGKKDLPVSVVKIHGPDVHLELGVFGAVYDAKLDANSDEMTGTFKQAGMNLPFTMKRTANPPIVPAPLSPADYAERNDSDVQGYWLGTITIGGMQSRIVFKITGPSRGLLRGEVDSIDQGANAIPMTAINYTGGNLHIEVDGVAGSFDGTVNRSSGEITGTWKQGPNALPMTLKRSAAIPVAKVK
jgi:hypothetical protein